MTLPAIGVFFYNGVTFPTETTTKVTSRPKYDDADRTVQFIVHTISCETTLTAASLISLLPESQPGVSGDPTDSVMATIRQRLTTPGAALLFEGRGFSSLSCNGGLLATDVDFGPKPRVVSWKPIGVAAAEVTWECEVSLPECPGTLYNGVYLSFSYTQDFSVDHLGNCSRTTTGVITIPLNRLQDGSMAGSTLLPDSADLYWEDLFNSFAIPYWSRRTTNQRYLSYSKKELRFRVVDTQMGQNMFPPYVSDMSASHSVEPIKTPGQQSIIGRYQLNFSASVTMVRSVPRSACYQAFLGWVQQRVAFILGAGFTLLPVYFRLEEPDTFSSTSPTGRFNLVFVMLQPLDQVNADTWLTGTGLWLDSQYTWEDWNASMQQGGVHAPYGSGGFRATPLDDELVDGCHQPGLTYGASFQYVSVPFGGIRAQFPVIKPSPKTSWISYQNKKVMHTDTGTVRHKLLPDTMQADPPTDINNDFDNDTQGTQPKDLCGSYSGADGTDVVQSAKSPTIKFRLVGYATRVAYDIPMPTLKTFDGNVIKPSGEPHFTTEQTGNYGYPINHAEWDIEYDIPYSDQAKVYVSISPDSPLPGQDIQDQNDTGDPLQGSGIDDSGESSDIFEDLGDGG